MHSEKKCKSTSIGLHRNKLILPDTVINKFFCAQEQTNFVTKIICFAKKQFDIALDTNYLKTNFPQLRINLHGFGQKQANTQVLITQTNFALLRNKLILLCLETN